MKNLLERLLRTGKNAAGFTMIELLVVIAIIGILAVAVLSTLNPIEQINRGRDTRSRADAAELLSGIERYYTTNEVYPWNVGQSGNAADPTESYIFDGTTGSWTWADSLVTANEVKQALLSRLTLDKKHFVIKLAGNAAGSYVCFQPVSTNFKTQAATNCSNGTTPTSGLPAGAPNLCATGAEWNCLP